MLAKQDAFLPANNTVDEAMAWHGGDARATIDALLQDRVKLPDELAMAKACMSRGYTRGWMPGRNSNSMRLVAVDSVPEFVAELVRAANEAERLQANEVRNLIFRAIATVRELREQVGIPGSGTPEDAVVGLHAIAVDAERRTSRERARALLEAADMVRTLRIVVDSGVEIALTPSR